MLQLRHLCVNYFYSVWYSMDCANSHSLKSFPGKLCEGSQTTASPSPQFAELGRLISSISWLQIMQCQSSFEPRAIVHLFNLLLQALPDGLREDPEDDLRLHHMVNPEWGFELQHILGAERWGLWWGCWSWLEAQDSLGPAVAAVPLALPSSAQT